MSAPTARGSDAARGEAVSTTRSHRITRLSPTELQILDILTGTPRTVLEVAQLIGNPNLRTYVASMRAKGVRVITGWRSWLDDAGRKKRCRLYVVEREERARVLGAGRS